MKFGSMNEILQTPIEDCVKHFKQLPKGELVNLLQLLKVQYEQVNNIKTSLLLLIAEHDKGENKMDEKSYQEHKDTVNELYTVLQLIEDRFNVTQETLNILNKEETQRVNEVLKNR